MNQGDFEKYLPKYLSTESQSELFSNLKGFPENIDSRLFTSNLEPNIVYQGDGIDNLLVINLPDPEINPVRCLVISNTCFTRIQENVERGRLV